MSYSNKTIAELCRALAAAVISRAELDLVFLENNLPSDQIGEGLQPRSNALVNALLNREDTEAALTRLVEYVLERKGAGSAASDRLLQSLRIDGFEWHEGRLVPTTPQPASLHPELSQLELDMQALNLSVAAQHYRQAYESFVASNWEAANGQIRSFMEGFLIALGNIETTNVPSNTWQLFRTFKNEGFFDCAEWQMLKGFWQGIQDNGPHYGLSNEEEALFRLHPATSIARYAIHKSQANRELDSARRAVS